jgi:hypothetical protein
MRKPRRDCGWIEGYDPPEKSNKDPEWEEQAKRLREVINNTLSEFALEWQLCFVMRFSYFDPKICEIAAVAGVAVESVFYRLTKIKAAIVDKYKDPIPPELARVALVGTRHPVKGFYAMGPQQRNQINDNINRLLRTHSIKEQYAFYTRYSPLALDAAALASQFRLNESADTVLGWLKQIEKEIASQGGFQMP